MFNLFTSRLNPGSLVANKTSRYKCVGVIMILSLIISIARWVYYTVINLDYNTFGVTEFLISFRGGFVRRGLLGQILLWFTSTTGIEPHYVIIPLCLLAYAFVLCFFLRKFREKGYLWWILLSPLMCGIVTYLIRKDYMLYCLMIAMLYLVKDSSPNIKKRIFAVVLAILGLLLHEAFIFWGIPLFAIVLLTQKKQMRTNILLLSTIIFAFGVLCVFKGDINIARAITDSWNEMLPEKNLNFLKEKNSISALSWDTFSTMKDHLHRNFLGETAPDALGVIYWPFFFCIVYYFLSFFFVAFQPKKDSFSKTSQAQLSFMILIVAICLMPMFTVLSCDYGRLFQYIGISTFAAFFILDNSVKERIIPAKIKYGIEKLNSSLSRLFVPSKGLLAFLLLTIGVSPFNFNIYAGIYQSPLVNFGITIVRISLRIYHLLL